MPVIADFTMAKYTDGVLTISLVPATAVGGWTIAYRQYRRFGSDSPLYTACVSSGFNGSSGILVTNSGQGVLQVTLPTSMTSGLDYGNYAGNCVRLDSGSYTVLSEGYLILTP